MMDESSSVPAVNEEVSHSSTSNFTVSNSAASESPSLAARVPDSPSAYEMKCLLDEPTAVALEAYLQNFMTMDPFAAAGDGHYAITTLSTDTSDFRTFLRQPGFAQRKLRIRRYGNEPRLYLEQKTRRGNKVRKYRTASDPRDLQHLVSGNADQKWPGDWFQARASKRLLLPVCVMSYSRRAWFGKGEHGPVRLTFDRNLRGMLTGDWLPEALTADTAAIERNAEFQPVVNGVICEFKFTAALPQMFKHAIEQFQLSPGGFSKYRNCMARLTGMSLPRGESQETTRA